MSERRHFEGKVLRVEPNGFGVVEFDAGGGANTHGIFSKTTIERAVPYQNLQPGTQVSGEAEFDEHELAAIKTLEVSNGD